MAVLFKTRGADFNATLCARETGPLEIGLAADLAGGVELGGTDAVGVTAGDQTTLVADCARFHSGIMLSCDIT